MSPIPGIVASQITGHLSTATYASIATVTVGSGGQTTIVFSSIPQTYKHLEIAMSILGSSYGALSTNNGGGSREHYMLGAGSGVGSTANNTGSLVPVDSSSSTTHPMVMFARILDYTSANKFKSVRDYEGFNTNSSGEVIVNSALLNGGSSASAITSLTFTATAGSSIFAQGTVASLYGIKG